MFFIVEKHRWKISCKMETQKIINLLNDSSNEESKFATKTGML